jgi:uncharacterized protein
MPGIEAVNDGMYFLASQQIASKQSDSAKKSRDTKEASSVKKTSFASIFQKSQAEQALINEGLPAEIAGMSVEDASIYLKDQAEIAGDKLKNSPIPENFADYKKKVSALLKYIVKNNFEFNQTVKARINRRGKQIYPKYQIQVIEKKLDEMATRFLYGQKDQLEMLKKVDEIHGLIVDLMAL